MERHLHRFIRIIARKKKGDRFKAMATVGLNKNSKIKLGFLLAYESDYNGSGIIGLGFQYSNNDYSFLYKLKENKDFTY